MNTITDNRPSIQNRIILHRKLFCLLLVLLFVGFASSQSPKKGIDVSKEYKNELKDRLCPEVDTSTTKIVALFVTKPSFADPECSIRIIDIIDKSFIEVRVLEKNLWEEQYKQNKQADSLSGETYCYSAPVSRSFRDKMLAAFTKVIELHEKRIKPDGIQLYDGICYEFMVNNNGNKLFAKIDYNLKYDDFRDQVASTNLRIIDVMRRHSFNESAYEIYK
jgi:hypothetical protein